MNFQQLYPFSEQLDQNDFFIQYYNPEALFRYDSNFFELLYTPPVDEFKLIEQMQLKFSEDYFLDHVKFVWPQDQGILPDTLDYLSDEKYGLEKLELYSIHPADFREKENPAVIVEVVDSTSLPLFKQINYVEDLVTSRSFAEHKQLFYDTIFADPIVTLRIAFLNNEAAGSCITIEQSDTVELDDIFTLPDFRYSGVARTLQSAVMSTALLSGKTVILAADAEDTPREMYLKQGYQYEGFRIGAIKKLEEEHE